VAGEGLLYSGFFAGTVWSVVTCSSTPKKRNESYVKKVMRMGFLENMSQQAKAVSIIDLKLAQGAAIFLALIIAKLHFPKTDLLSGQFH
jgi:hypothetical protein